MTSKGLRSFVIGASAVGSAALAAYALLIGPWHRRWGATDQEVARSMPGDDLVPDANFSTTRAITINARPADVWPWLVQIGQGRAGFYSYDLLENLAGLNIHSVQEIIPEYQDLQIGDVIPLEPGGSGYTVAAMEPERRLVLHADSTQDTALEQGLGQVAMASTWVYELEERPPTHTRLIVRWRARMNPIPASFSGAALFGALIAWVIEPIEFLMEQKMMRGIKARAEAVTNGQDGGHAT
jgi:hypothetical protein